MSWLSNKHVIVEVVKKLFKIFFNELIDDKINGFQDLPEIIESFFKI